VGKNTPSSIRARQIPSKEVLAMRGKKVIPKFEEPASSKFDPDFSCWVLSSRFGGSHGCLMNAIDELFEHTNASDYYSKSQVIDACLKFGYFGYGNFAIYYLPQSNTSSLNLMEGK
jgi:hypothetical protein